MSDHQYYYEVRKQDPMHYIDRVLLAEIMARDPVVPSSHLTRFNAAHLTVLVLLAVLAAQYVPMSPRSPSMAQEAEVRDPGSFVTTP